MLAMKFEKRAGGPSFEFADKCGIQVVGTGVVLRQLRHKGQVSRERAKQKLAVRKVANRTLRTPQYARGGNGDTRLVGLCERGWRIARERSGWLHSNNDGSSRV